MPNEPLHFLSEVGRQITMFVPDRGSPGLTAVLGSPDGGEEILEEDSRTEGHEARDGLEALGPRVGFKLPVFDEPGEYILVVDDEDETYTYIVTVTKPDDLDAVRAWWDEHGGSA